MRKVVNQNIQKRKLTVVLFLESKFDVGMLSSNQLSFLIDASTLCRLPLYCFLHSHFNPSDLSSTFVNSMAENTEGAHSAGS